MNTKGGYECLCKKFEYLKEAVAHTEKLMFGDTDLGIIGDRTNILHGHALEIFPEEFKKRPAFIDTIRKIEEFFKQNWPDEILECLE